MSDCRVINTSYLTQNETSTNCYVIVSSTEVVDNECILENEAVSVLVPGSGGRRVSNRMSLFVEKQQSDCGMFPSRPAVDPFWC